METTAFRIEGEWTPGPLALQVLEEFPHSIHFDYSLQPDRWHKIRDKVYYCAECEAQARIMRWREQGRKDGKLGGAASRGRPISSETSRKSSAAGSDG